MSFPHECNGCGSQFDVPEELAGQQATCAACGRLMDLPLPPSEMGAPAGPGSGSESFLDVRAKPHLPIGERSEGAAWRTPSAVRLAIGVSVASVLIGVIVVSYLMQQRGRSSWRDRVRADRSSRRPFDPEASYIYVDNNSEQLIVAQLDGGAAKEIAPWDILRMDVRAGAHRVSVEGKGRKRWEKRLDVRPGRTYIADPAGIGHYGVWELSYTPVGQQPHAVLSRRTQLDHRWGGRTLHTVTLPVHYQIREPPAQIIRTRVSTVRRMLRKLPPAPVPEALIKRMLDMKLQGVFREVYHETSRMKALEEGAKLGLDEVRIYLFAQLEGKKPDRATTDFICRYATMEWLPELTTWIQRNAGRPVAPAVFQKFVQLAGDKEMKAVYPGLSAGGQKNLLSMLSSRPYADGVGVAMLAVGNPGTRDVGLRLLLRPEAARHPEALKVVLSMQDKSMIRLDWSTRARLVGVLLAMDDESKSVPSLLKSALESCSDKQIYAAGKMIQHIRGRQNAEALAKIFPSLSDRLRRQLVLAYYSGQRQNATDISTEPFLLVAAKDPNSETQIYVRRVLQLAKFARLPKCRAALLSLQGRRVGYSSMTRLQQEVRVALKAVPKQRVDKLLALVSRSGRYVVVVTRAFRSLPPAERVEAHRGLRELLPGLSRTQRFYVIEALVGESRVSPTTWSRYAAFLTDESSIVRLGVFILLAKQRRAIEGVREALTQAAEKELNAGVRQQMEAYLRALNRRR